MDSRLRENDGVRRIRLSVIPAKAGIHAKTGETCKEIIYIYSNISVVALASVDEIVQI
jgi:hypothetical protein